MIEFEFAVEAVPEEEIRSRVSELGENISGDFDRRSPLLIAIMKGSIPFAADLLRSIDVETEVDFLGLNRFGESGRISIAVDVSTAVYDRHVILIEDIIDTGLTLTVLRRMMLDRGAASVSTATLLDKTRRRVTSVPIEYRGFEVGDEFLVGYGMDWQGYYRNLRSMWAVLDLEAFVDDPLILARHLGFHTAPRGIA